MAAAGGRLAPRLRKRGTHITGNPSEQRFQRGAHGRQRGNGGRCREGSDETVLNSGSTILVNQYFLYNFNHLLSLQAAFSIPRTYSAGWDLWHPKWAI